jgi:hypothetical protein
MSKRERLASIIVDLAGKFGEGTDHASETAAAQELMGEGGLQCIAMNVTLVYKAVLSVDGVDDANDRDAYWGGFVDWMDGKSVDIRDKGTWISLFRSKLAPAVMDQSSKQREDDIKSGSSVRSPTLRSLGISVQLAKYDGARGKCGVWWRTLSRTLVSMQVPKDQYMPVVIDSLSGVANTEFWRLFDAMEAARSGSADVQSIVNSMIDLFDAGLHRKLLQRLRSMDQQRGESVLAFRSRFLEVITALGHYGYRYDDDQLMTMFSIRLLNWDAIAAHRPRTIADVLLAVSQLGGDTKTVSAGHLAVVRDSTGGTTETRSCFYCKEIGHLKWQCPKKKKREQEAKQAAAADSLNGE